MAEVLGAYACSCKVCTCDHLIFRLSIIFGYFCTNLLYADLPVIQSFDQI